MAYTDMFSGENAVTSDEVVKFAAQTNAIGAITKGIQPDNSKSVISHNNDGNDPLVARLLNNGVAQAAEILIDPCKTGREKYYFQTPYVINDTPVGKEDSVDSEECCVGTPSMEACRYKLHLNELCVKDCVSSTLDEMIEKEVKQHTTDTRDPFTEYGKSFAKKRAKFVARYARFIFERNFILGTQETKKDALRPFDGLISRLTDKRTLKIDGSAGVLESIMMADCRLMAMGREVGRYIFAINPILLPTLKQEVRTYLKADPLSDWKLSGNTVSYRGNPIVTSRFVDVDLSDNTTSVWLIDPAYVGIKTVFTPTNPYIRRDDDRGDQCKGHCVSMHLAGSTIVTDWNGLILINNVKLDSICDSLVLSGLDAYINSGVVGQLYPKVTQNPGL